MAEKFTLIGIAKNEGPFLLEWVAHHLLTGFDNIIIFQNDSDDYTHQTLACLRKLGIVNYKYNRAKRGAHQVSAYIRSTKQPEFKEADWIMALDLDEFLNIKIGNGTLPDLISAIPDVHKVLINWAMFGNDGHITLSDDLVIERFTHADDPEPIKNIMGAYKTLFRREAYFRPGIHRPNRALLDESLIKTANGSGLMDGQFQLKNFRCNDPKGRKLVQINHYIIRDAQSFVLKSDKGSAHQADRLIQKDYWNSRNKNEKRDMSLAGRKDAVWLKMVELDNMSNGDLLKFRRLAIEAHHKKFETVLAKKDNKELYEYCCA